MGLWWIALELYHVCLPAACAHLGDRRQQRQTIRMERTREEFATPGTLYDFSQIHDGDFIADVFNDRHVMRDEHIGKRHFALQSPQKVQYLRANGHVERRHRLVANNEPRSTGKRARDIDALTLAA